MTARADRALILASVAAALSVPLALSEVVRQRLRCRVEPTLSAAAGVDVRIDDVEITLTGALRLDGLRVGDVLAAESVSAAVGWRTLLDGRFDADEITVTRPRVRAQRRPDGTLDVAEVLTRLSDARRSARPTSGRGRAALRRIIVTGGELVVTVEGHGELRARDLELHPQEGGVRVVASGLSVDLAGGPWRLEASFARSAADVELPTLRPGRAALDGGQLALRAGDAPPLVLERAVVARGVGGADTRLKAHLPTGEPLTARLGAGGAFELDATALPLDVVQPALPAWAQVAGARATTHLVGRWHGGALDVDGAVELRGAAVRHDLLSREPLPLAGSFVFQLGWDRGARAGRAQVQAQTGALVAEVELELALDAAGRATRARLGATIPDTSCDGALAAVPLPLRRRLDGLIVDGTIGGRAEIGFDPERVVFDVDLDVACRVNRDATNADVAALAGPYVHTLPDGSARVLDPRDPGFVELDDLPAHVVGAFVAGEDARFYRHRGFDLEQLRRSFEIDVRAGRVERGGSTITQQLVKNLYLTRERTVARKLLEAVLTWRLEQRLPKARILEAYLNIIELGEGTFGIGPAARRWFGKEPSRLTVAEAAFLAALTPAPVSTDRRLREHGLVVDPLTERRVRAVLRSMRINRVIDEATYQRAVREKLKLQPSGA